MKNSEFEKLTIATSCMNRNDMLIKTVPTWLKFPVKEIIIVDWSSTIPVKTTLEENNINDERIRIISVPNQSHYHHSKARNLKVFCCNTEWVLSIDADVKINDNFFDNIYFLSGKKLYSLNLDGGVDSRFGTTMFRKKDYIDVGGCNTKMIGWGYEDLDLAIRMLKNDVIHIAFDKELLYHIPHDDTRRTENTEFKNKWESNSNNSYIATRNEQVNWEPFDFHYEEIAL